MMAIHSIPLLVPPAASPMQGGIEMYVAECHHVFDGAQVVPGSEVHEFRGITVLLNFSSDVADRAALRPLLHALTFARCSTVVFGAGEWPQRLTERFSSARPDFVAAAIYGVNKSGVVAETVQLGIEVLRRCFADALAVVVVVSAPFGHSLAVDEATGFVCGLGATTGATARSVFLVLSALIAPRTLNGIDLVDLLSVLGTGAEPAVLTEVLWTPHRPHPLCHLSRRGLHELHAARMVLSVPFIPHLTWPRLRSVQVALSSAIGQEADLVIFATDGALSEGLLPQETGWIPMLSRRKSRSLRRADVHR